MKIKAKFGSYWVHQRKCRTEGHRGAGQLKANMYNTRRDAERITYWSRKKLFEKMKDQKDQRVAQEYNKVCPLSDTSSF